MKAWTVNRVRLRYVNMSLYKQLNLTNVISKISHFLNRFRIIQIMPTMQWWADYQKPSSHVWDHSLFLTSAFTVENIPPCLPANQTYKGKRSGRRAARTKRLSTLREINWGNWPQLQRHGHAGVCVCTHTQTQTSSLTGHKWSHKRCNLTVKCNVSSETYITQTHTESSPT